VNAILRFHGHDVSSTRPFRPGDSLRVRLWWSVADGPPVDYLLDLAILGPNGEPLVTRTGPPEGPLAPARTSEWEAGRLYVDQRVIRLPRPLGAGIYPVRLRVVGAAWAPAVSEDLTLGEIEVFAYR
jgi:hypothetical protein